MDNSKVINANTNDIKGVINSRLCGNYKIYTIETTNALNQLAGLFKFAHRDAYEVYFRGERRYHSSLLPALSRPECGCDEESLRKNIEEVKRTSMSNEIRLTTKDPEIDVVCEALLQHYGCKTHCLDAVDNLWVALWFGNNRFKEDNNKVIIEPVNDDEYQYIYAIAVPKNSAKNKVKKMDLRTRLSSYCLRPHAQHGIIIKNDNAQENYDLTNNICGIVEIKHSIAAKLLGEGELLTLKNLFPPKEEDKAYEELSKVIADIDEYSY